jgi:hypothetical protein
MLGWSQIIINGRKWSWRILRQSPQNSNYITGFIIDQKRQKMVVAYFKAVSKKRTQIRKAGFQSKTWTQNFRKTNQDLKTFHGDKRPGNVNNDNTPWKHTWASECLFHNCTSQHGDCKPLTSSPASWKRCMESRLFIRLLLFKTIYKHLWAYQAYSPRFNSM